MKAIILLNGEPYPRKINCDGALVICCDGAYRWAAGKVRIDVNLGDYDSFSGTPEPLPEAVYPSEKDFTDGEIALERALSSGADEIEIYGGGGGREDHFIGNIHLLYKAFLRGARATMFNARSYMFAASGRIELKGIKGKTFSLLPFGGSVHIMDYGGVKYAYPDTISYGECRGISNIAEDELAYADVKGVALIIVNRGKV